MPISIIVTHKCHKCQVAVIAAHECHLAFSHILLVLSYNRQCSISAKIYSNYVAFLLSVTSANMYINPIKIVQ